MGTHPIEMAVASSLSRLSLVNTEVRSAGISVRLATGIRRVIPGNSTDPLGKGRIGRVWDLLWPMFLTGWWPVGSIAVGLELLFGRMLGSFVRCVEIERDRK